MSLRHRIASFARRPVVRHAGLLTGSTVVAQLIALAATPLLTRLYSPAHFGLLGLLMNLATIGGAVAAFCYEQAILQPRSERMARSLFALSMQLSVVGSAIAIFAVIGLALWRPELFGQRLDAWFYVFGFLGVLTTLHMNTISHVLSRKALFRPIAIGKINQTLLPVGGQLLWGAVRNSDAGLLGGRTVGLLVASLLVQRSLPVGYRMRDVLRTPPRLLWRVAGRYRDYVLHVPRAILVRGATTAPAILVMAYYGPVIGGYFYFAQRVVERPGMLLSDALIRLPFRRFSEIVARREPLMRATLRYSLACSVPVVIGCLALALLAGPAVPVLFGSDWAPAADYAVILGTWAAVRLSTLPMTTATTVLRIQAASLTLDAAFFGFRVGAIPFIASQGHPALLAVTVYCVLSVAYHIAAFALGFWAVLRHDRNLRRSKVPPRSLDPGVSGGREAPP
jgi:O-antigen/teichoic acid export membrane protein